MFKGFFAGLAWGVLLAAIMVVVANEMAVRNELTDEPVASAVELPAGSAFDAVRTDMPPRAPGGADSLPGAAVPTGAPSAARPEALPRTGAAAPVPAVPEAGDTPPLGAAPETVGGEEMATGPAPSADVRPGLPPSPALITEAPDAAPVAVEAAPPAAETPAVSAETQTPEPPALWDSPPPLPGKDGSSGLTLPGGAAPEPPSLPGVEVTANGSFPAQAPDLPPVHSAGVTRPAAPEQVASLAPPAPDSAVALPPPGSVRVAANAPDAPVTPAADTESAPAPDAVRTAAPLAEEPATGSDAARDPAVEAAPVDVAEPSSEPAAPVSEPESDVPSDPKLAPSQEAARRIPTGRLVQTGVPDEPEGVGEAAPQDDSDLPEDALSRNAAAFENPEGLPILSIVLLDSGDLPLELPFQATFALDPSAPEAVTRARVYRGAGHEVLVLPALPEGASARDAAQAIEGSRALLDQAVGLIDSPEGGLQASRGALEQVVAEALETGHGLVTFPRGLNSAQRVAQREGVVTGVVFRDIDGAGQDASAVKRFLDQAAFRARQEGAAIVFARVRPETVSGLAEWVLGHRAQSVLLAPVSAALKAGAGL